MTIVGIMICQNGIHEIFRAIDSVLPSVSEYYILDGGSDDGTWELLNKYKDIYGLTLFQRTYDNQDSQRNYLLNKIPKNVWCVNIDQDEQLSHFMTVQLKDFINKTIDSDLYTTKSRKIPLSLIINCINLVKSPLYFDASHISNFTSKVFYNDRNLHFTGGYHCNICYKDNEKYNNSLPTFKEWAIKHYAYINPERINNPKKGRDYKKHEWDISKKNIQPLPRYWL